MMAAKFEDLRQSGEWAKYLSHLGWLTVRAKSKEQRANIFVRKLPLIGAVAKIQRPFVIPSAEEIDRVAKMHRLLFVKLEPGLGQGQALQLRTVGKRFEPDNWPLSPTRTIHLDLTPSEEEIFGKFSKDARYSIRKAQKAGAAVVCKPACRSGRAWPFENLKTFHQLFTETGKRKKFWVPPFEDLKAKVEAFKDKSVLILASHNEEPIAGALILFHDQVAYYHHAASSPTGRKLLAPYLVVWGAIKLSKARGCHTLDLEGIYDPRYKIYRRFRKIGIFKKKFGGREVEYPGSFIRYYNQIVKFVFNVSSWVR